MMTLTTQSPAVSIHLCLYHHGPHVDGGETQTPRMMKFSLMGETYSNDRPKRFPSIQRSRKPKRSGGIFVRYFNLTDFEENFNW